MILWMALFLLVVLISFVLAYRSMRDFYLTPTKIGVEYGLFLIREPQGLTEYFLDYLWAETLENGLVFSLERLFKGQQATLVIFGPKDILISVSDRLNLLELEDYTQLDADRYLAWEVGSSPREATPEAGEAGGKIFENMPPLLEDEQFWWQVNIRAQKSKSGLDDKLFLAQIRCVFLSNNLQRQKKLTEQLSNLGQPILSKIPKPFSSQKILQFYQKRSLTLEKNNPILTGGQILRVVKLNILN